MRSDQTLISIVGVASTLREGSVIAVITYDQENVRNRLEEL
jgi:hypothetical protein